MTLFYVAIGGAVGALARYLVGQAASFPYGTLSVNVIGSFLMGVAFVILAQKGMDRFAPLIMSGALGGFTTFSAFSLDAFRLVEMEKYAGAAGYVTASVALSLMALFLAVALTRMVIS